MLPTACAVAKPVLLPKQVGWETEMVASVPTVPDAVAVQPLVAVTVTV